MEVPAAATAEEAGLEYERGDSVTLVSDGRTGTVRWIGYYGDTLDPYIGLQMHNTKPEYGYDGMLGEYILFRSPPHTSYFARSSRCQKTEAGRPTVVASQDRISRPTTSADAKQPQQQQQQQQQQQHQQSQPQTVTPPAHQYIETNNNNPAVTNAEGTGTVIVIPNDKGATVEAVAAAVAASTQPNGAAAAADATLTELKPVQPVTIAQSTSYLTSFSQPYNTSTDYSYASYPQYTYTDGSWAMKYPSPVTGTYQYYTPTQAVTAAAPTAAASTTTAATTTVFKGERC